MKLHGGKSLKGRSRLQIETLESRQLLSGFQPTAQEQFLLEQLNDIRANPAAYGATIGVDLSGVAPAQPLAFDPILVQVAQQHSQDMNDQGYFGQISPQGFDPGQRLTQAGFAWASWRESLLAGANYPDTTTALRALITDLNNPSLIDRNQLLAVDALSQSQGLVGIGIVPSGNGPLTNYFTIDTASTSDIRPFLTGVVYNDNNGNGHYDIGEGLGNITITVSNGSSSFTTTTFDSGGYTLQLNPGTYTVTASGGSLAAPISQSVSVATTNARLNFVVSSNNSQAKNAAWVELVYHDLLGRSATTSELQTWLNSMAGGMSMSTVVQSLLRGQEFATRRVTAWYELYLNRAPDSAGLSFFVGQLEHGTSANYVRLEILASQEYFALQGNSATNFVTSLYQNILGRTPQGNEASSWVSLASGGNRTGVVAGILGSMEYKTDEVNAYYAAFLRRGADKPGQGFFLSELQARTDESLVIQQFLSSQEYVNNAQDVLWLQRIYQDVLGRNGDSPNDLGSWLGALHGGTTHTAVATAILSSTEMFNRTITQLYERLLGRQPTASELTTASALLQRDGRIAELATQLVASPEYFALHGSDNTQWVTGLYQDLLGRTPSTAEVQFWMGQLNSHATLTQVASQFTGGLEFQQDYVRAIFTIYLHRAPTTAELTAAVAQIQANATDATIAAAILSSSEYYGAMRSY
jgi:hypothetical protein